MVKSAGVKGLIEHMVTLRRLSLKSLPSVFPATHRSLASFTFLMQSHVRLPMPWLYGWHYRLSRVISGGQSQHLTLCSPSSLAPSWTPVLLSHGEAAVDPEVRTVIWYKGRDLLKENRGKRGIMSLTEQQCLRLRKVFI